MDGTLRELEHALALSPRNDELRIRLASALARAGRRRDALATLALAAIGAEHFAAARLLADQLWLPALSKLEPALVLREAAMYEVSHTLDLSGRLAAWRSWNHRPGLEVTDLETGATLFADAALADPWPVPVTNGFFLLDKERRLIRRLSLHEGRIEETSVDAAPDVDGLAASPSGELVALTEGHRRLQHWHWEDDEPRPQATQTIARWPGLEPVLAVPGYDNQFDWESRVAVGFGTRVTPFDGSAPWTIESGTRDRLEPLGGGLLGNGFTLTVVGVRGGPLVQLVPGRSARGSTSSLDGFLALSSDGRGLRVVTNGHAVRFELEAGQVVRASRDPSELEKAPGTTVSGPWHPHADVLACRGPVPSVRSLDAALATLPLDASPVAWVLDGEGLLLARTTVSRLRFEVWRLPR